MGEIIFKVYNAVKQIESDKFFITSGINEAMLISFLEYVDNGGKDVFISSDGGDADFSLAMYDYIMAKKLELKCTVIGECSSSALYIFLACSERVATWSSRFMHHRPVHSGDRSWWKRLKKTTSYPQEALALFQKHSDEIFFQHDIGYGVHSAQSLFDKGILHEIL